MNTSFIRVSLSSFFAGALFFGTSAALASPSHPGTVQGKLMLSAAPQCLLCHEGSPGAGTVKTPFGLSIRARGAQGGGDSASINAAIDKLIAEKVDSDRDCATDVDELKAGTDPNSGTLCADAGPPSTPPGTTEPPPPPEYGCVANVSSAPASGTSQAASFVACSTLFAAIVLRIGRRKPRAPKL
jgi:hypothetical protein